MAPERFMAVGVRLFLVFERFDVFRARSGPYWYSICGMYLSIINF